MAKPTAVVTSHVVTMCNNVSHLITSSTYWNVMEYSNIFPCIISSIQIFVTIFITWEAMTMKNILIPLFWRPPWRCLPSEFALRCRDGFLMSSLLCSSEVFLSFCRFLTCSFAFIFWIWRTYLMLLRSASSIMCCFLVVSKTWFIIWWYLTIQDCWVVHEHFLLLCFPCEFNYFCFQLMAWFFLFIYLILQ